MLYVSEYHGDYIWSVTDSETGKVVKLRGFDIGTSDVPNYEFYVFNDGLDTLTDYQNSGEKFNTHSILGTMEANRFIVWMYVCSKSLVRLLECIESTQVIAIVDECTDSIIVHDVEDAFSSRWDVYGVVYATESTNVVFDLFRILTIACRYDNFGRMVEDGVIRFSLGGRNYIEIKLCGNYKVVIPKLLTLAKAW